MIDPYLPTNSFPADLFFSPFRFPAFMHCFSWHFHFCWCAMYILGYGSIVFCWNLKGGESAERNRRRPRHRLRLPTLSILFPQALNPSQLPLHVFRRFDNHDSHVFVSLKWRLVLLWLLLAILLSCLVPAAQLLTSTADAVTSSVAQAGLDRLSFIIIISSLTTPRPASWTLLRSCGEVQRLAVGRGH